MMWNGGGYTMLFLKWIGKGQYVESASVQVCKSASLQSAFVAHRGEGTENY